MGLLYTLGVMARPVELLYLAENLRGFRKRFGISQDELAHRCRVHRTFLGGIERAERNVTVKTLSAISHATGVSIGTLLKKGGIK